MGHRHVGRGHGTYGVLAHDSAASHLEIKAAGEGVAGDEEELLLEADVGLDALDVVADVLEEARALLAHRLHTVATSRVSIHPSRSGARHARAPVPRGSAQMQQEAVGLQKEGDRSLPARARNPR